MLKDENVLLERIMREILQREFLTALRHQPDLFIQHRDDDIPAGTLRAGLVLLRGGSIKHGHVPTFDDDVDQFYHNVSHRVPLCLRFSVYVAEDPNYKAEYEVEKEFSERKESNGIKTVDGRIIVLSHMPAELNDDSNEVVVGLDDVGNDITVADLKAETGRIVDGKIRVLADDVRVSLDEDMKVLDPCTSRFKDELHARHGKAYAIGEKLIRNAVKDIGGTLRPINKMSAPLIYQTDGDGDLRREYTRDEMVALIMKYKKNLAAADIEVEKVVAALPDKHAAVTGIGYMKCIGLVPPAQHMPHRDIDWARYQANNGTQAGTAALFFQDLRRTASVGLSLLMKYGQNESMKKEDPESLAAWLLDVYNVSVTMKRIMRRERGSPDATFDKQMLQGLTLINLVALGANVHGAMDPTRLVLPFFFRDLVQGAEKDDLVWLADALNKITGIEPVTGKRIMPVNAKTLLTEVYGVFLNVFPQFGRDPKNVLALSDDAKEAIKPIFAAIDTFVPEAMEFRMPRLNEEKFTEAFPDLERAFPSLLDRADLIIKLSMAMSAPMKRQHEEVSDEGVGADARTPGWPVVKASLSAAAAWVKRQRADHRDPPRPD